jgi:hypothetical protein
MQRLTKKNLKTGLPMLAAAAATAWIGVPAAHADFEVSFRTTSTGTGATGGGATSTVTPFLSNATITNAATGHTEAVNVYVIQAFNDGNNGTGSTLAVFDAAVSTPGTGTTGALYIDISADTNGDGAVDADVYGLPDSGNGPNGSTPTPSYGTTQGTFFAVAGAAGYTAASAKKATVPNGSNYFSSSPFVNDQVVAPLGSDLGNPAVVASTTNPTTGSTIAPFVDANFLNETVHAMEISAAFASSNTPANVSPVQFLNLVVPVGTTLTVNGIVGGETGNNTAFSFTNGTVTATGATVSLTNANAPVYASNSFTATIVGHAPGQYTEQDIAVPAGDQITGSLVIGGFTQGDNELYALEVLVNGAAPTTAQLNSIAGELNTSLGAAGTASLSSPSPSFSSLYNLFITFTAPSADPAFNYNFSTSGTAGITIPEIGVVPEPTGVGVLVLGCMGLLARRRRLGSEQA